MLQALASPRHKGRRLRGGTKTRTSTPLRHDGLGQALALPRRQVAAPPPRRDGSAPAAPRRKGRRQALASGEGRLRDVVLDQVERQAGLGHAAAAALPRTPAPAPRAAARPQIEDEGGVEEAPAATAHLRKEGLGRRAEGEEEPEEPPPPRGPRPGPAASQWLQVVEPLRQDHKQGHEPLRQEPQARPQASPAALQWLQRVSDNKIGVTLEVTSWSLNLGSREDGVVHRKIDPS